MEKDLCRGTRLLLCLIHTFYMRLWPLADEGNMRAGAIQHVSCFTCFLKVGSFILRVLWLRVLLSLLNSFKNENFSL